MTFKATSCAWNSTFFCSRLTQNSVGMQKPKELFYFFSIEDAATFKTHLASDIAPILTSAEQMLNRTKEPLVLLNVAFSQTGITALGIADDLGDVAFSQGQVNDVDTLGETTDLWKDAFKGTSIHGVILIASDTTDLINQQVVFIETTFGSSLRKLYSLDGAMRPGEMAGHESELAVLRRVSSPDLLLVFGFKDGIAQPALKGFGTPLPGQLSIDPGMILVGMDGGASNSASIWARP